LTTPNIGAATGTSFTAAKADGVPGQMGVYETNSTDTYQTGWMGAPGNIADDMWYQFPDADPTVGQIMMFGAPAAGISPVTWGCASPVIKIVDNDYTIGTTNPCELYGGIIYVTVTAKTLTIPAVSGLDIDPVAPSFTVITIGDILTTIDPNGADQILLDGDITDMAAGDSIDNASTSGDIAVCTYYSADGWVCITNGWTDGDV